MKEYEKTDDDKRREENDLRSNPLMRWLQNQDAFKFNPGDILIKKNRSYSYNHHANVREDKWVTEAINKNTGAPKKYVYAFENKLGIGYLRQLKADGSGFCGTLICVANFDPENTKLELDPDFLDHTLIGEGEFQPNVEYLAKKKFRQEAMDANKKLLIKTSSEKQLIQWYTSLKVGDEFWFGQTFDEFAENKYQVTKIIQEQAPVRPTPGTWSYADTRDTSTKYRLAERMGKEWVKIEVKILESNHPYHKAGSTQYFDVSAFSWKKVSMTQPHPMKDKLCGPPK